MPNQGEQQIIQGILFSEAALVVEAGFRSVLGMEDEDLAKVSSKDKCETYTGDDSRLKDILVYVISDEDGGLPSMNPPRTILKAAFNGISAASTIGLVIQRVSDFAFYYVVEGVQ